ncbi:phage tail assembly protein [Shewanella sp. D64]|uniref:phage tail assembly protein n=1 Tax=unclassified Shewanella TaxID=196818 RepID=UPI0022BA2F32|nr:MULTISPECIES: phage tail assembly protein [unclassified Shewanella]MEC4728996.1 phage tail assembly protein [Shewanella sp. D64]MEC4740022.1 phage tail assembly protein [Shewanella sp. E94]WBJ94378.1 phage tail assembly protein [Shewanella sp. MTB7]
MSAKIVNVKLAVPFEKDGVMIESVDLRKPYAGDLRGLKLPEVVEMDFDTACTLLPRISILNERDLLNMEVDNFPLLMVQIASFFVDTGR